MERRNFILTAARWLCVIIFLAIVSVRVSAQIDKIQYIPPFFATDYNNGVDVKDQWIILSTPETTPFSVKVSIGSRLYRTVTISKSAPDSIYLGSGWSSATQTTGIIREDSLNTILKAQGFVLEGEKQFFAAIYQRSGAQGDILTCKGQTALGQTFYSGHIYGQFSTGASANDRRSQMLTVMATFDNTVVTFSNPRAKWLGQSNNTFSVTLNKYESYAVGASYTDIKNMGYVVNDYNGTKVTSTKPIVVNTGSWCGSGDTGGSQDIGIDQLVPANYTGKEYVAVKGYGTPQGERLIVVATKSNTSLKVNGITRHTFSKEGEYFVVADTEYNNYTNNLSLEASENIYVFQTLSGRYSDVSVGLCFMPPLSCLGNREVNISYADRIGDPLLNLVTEKGATLKINGKTVIQTPNNVTGNPDWVSYRIATTEMLYYDNPPSEFEIVSSAALNAALSFNDGAIGGAGFYSGFGVSPQVDPKPNLTGTVACFPDNVVLKAEGYDEYIWYLDNIEIPNQNSGSLIPEVTGQYKARGKTNCGTTKASDPFIVKTCLTAIGGGEFYETNDSATIIFQLGLPSDEPITFWYRTVAGTATEGADYVGVSNFKTFEPGEYIDSIKIPLLDDNLDEADVETFIFEIYSSDNATIQIPQLEFRIKDNDATPNLIIEKDVKVAENAGSMAFNVFMDAYSAEVVTVQYQTVDSNAVSGVHYTGQSGTLSFNPRENMKTINVPIFDNDIYNEHRYFKLIISNPQHANLYPNASSRFGIILNDEAAPPCLSISDVSVDEGDSLKFKISMNKTSLEVVSFLITALHGNTSADDFKGEMLKVKTFNPGDSVFYYILATKNDTIEEADEVLLVSISNVINAEVCDAEAIGVIRNNDYVPHPVNDVYVCQEDARVAGNVMTNDVVKGDFPALVYFNAPTHGNLTVSKTDGSFEYVPDPDYFGADRFTYSLIDASGDAANASVLVNVEPVNDAPVAQNDTVAIDEDESINIYLLKNDIDVDRKGLIIDEIEGALLGNVINNGSYVTYIPNPDVFGFDTLSYTIQDNDGDKVTANLYISIASVNEAPTANADFATGYEDVPLTIDVLQNDMNHDAGTISFVAVSDPEHGTASIVNNKINYVPDPGYYGEEIFTYTIKDGQDDEAIGTITLTIVMVNNSPSAKNDIFQTNEDTWIVMDVSQNDKDEDGYIVAVEITYPPTSGIAEVVNDTLISYLPSGNYHGNDQLKYKITDNEGGVSNDAIVNIIIEAVNDTPTVCNLEATIVEDLKTRTYFDPLVCATDPDKSGLKVQSVMQPLHGSASVSAGNATFSYLPNEDYFGIDTVYFTIADGEGDGVTAYAVVTITNVNDVPRGIQDNINSDEDLTITIDVLANDYDVDLSGLSLQSLSQPTHGTVEIVGNKVLFTPEENYFGFDSFEYFFVDGEFDAASGQVNLVLNQVNDSPIAVSDQLNVSEDVSTALDVLANDKDIDLSGLTLVSVRAPMHGTVTIVDNKAVYLSDNDFYGADSFKYIMEDAEGDRDSTTVTVTVDFVNDVPVANADVAETDEDVALVIDVMANDYDADKTGLQIDRLTQPAHGTVSITNNKVEFTPELDYFGADEFSYTIKDAQGDEATSTVSITINSVNDVPVAMDDTVYVDEDVAAIFDVVSNDYDPDKGGLTLLDNFTIYSGSVRLVDNKIEYTPVQNYFGTNRLQYSVVDAQGDRANARLVIIVLPVNDRPVAVDDYLPLYEDLDHRGDNGIRQFQMLFPLKNDLDIDRSGLTIKELIIPNGFNGTLEIANSIDIRYVPEKDYFGFLYFDYVIADGENDLDTARFDLKVIAVNDVPIANADNVTTNEDEGITVDAMLNDYDADKGGISIVAITSATHGLAEIVDNKVNYMPELDYYGTDEVTYTIEDAQGDRASAKIVFTVEFVNDVPVASADIAETDEDIVLVIDVMANDYDADKTGLQIDRLTQPAHGTVVISSGKVEFTPELDYFGADEFTYTIKDAQGDEAAATVFITVNSVNDVPIAYLDSVSVLEDSQISIDAMANDYDADKTGINITRIGQPTFGTSTLEDNKIVYVPNHDFYGFDYINYTITDAQGDTAVSMVAITVDFVNDVPVAYNDTIITDEDMAITFMPVDNDYDADHKGLDLVSFQNPQHGTITIDSNDTIVSHLLIADSLGGHWDVGPREGWLGMSYWVDYRFTFTPEKDYYGDDSFTYTVKDREGDETTATVYLTMNSVNDVPIANTDSVTTSEDEGITVDALLNDYDADKGGLTIVEITSANHGVAQIVDNKVTYMPELDYYGTDEVIYTIEDAQGDRASAKIVFTIHFVNDVPIANADIAETDEDIVLVVDVMDNDYDSDKTGIVIERLTQPAHGVVVIASGKVEFTPELDYFGVDEFTYTIKDAQGDEATATVNLTINFVNDIPVAVEDNVVTDEDVPFEFDVLSNDYDPDKGGLTLMSVTGAEHGVAKVVNNKVSYAPTENYHGKDRIYYTFKDAQGDKVTSRAIIDIISVNDIPVAMDDQQSFREDESSGLIFGHLLMPLDNDLNPDFDRSTINHYGGLTIREIIIPDEFVGSLEISDSFGDVFLRFFPELDYFGNLYFHYVIADAQGDLDTARFDLEIIPVNDNPVANNDSISTLEDNAVTVNILSNDYDADKTGLTIKSITGLSNGTFTELSLGMYQYVPNMDYNGTENLKYVIEDGQGDLDSAYITIKVISVNDIPVAENDLLMMDEDNSASIDVLANDYDPDKGGLRIVSIDNPTLGTIEWAGSVLSFTPFANYHGAETLRYSIVDAQSDTAKAEVQITVNSINENPIANNDQILTNEEVSVSINVLSNDEDPDWEGIELIAVNNVLGGQVSFQSNGNVTYTPALDWYGVENMAYVIKDAQGDTDTALLIIKVIDVNDQPVAVDDAAITNEDVSINIPILHNDLDKDHRGISINYVSDPNNGSVVLTDTSIIYTPNANYHGADLISYSIKDKEGDVDFAKVNITVESVNDVPVAHADSAYASEDKVADFYVLLNDEDPDFGGLSILSASKPEHGTVTISNQKLKYLSDVNYFGADSLMYVVVDAQNDKDSAWVYISVLPQNDYPIANNDTVETLEDVAVVISPLVNDTDVDGTVDSYLILEQPKLGTISSLNGQITYRPKANVWGNDTIVYVARDNFKANSEPASIFITILSVNDVPVAGNVSKTLNEEASDTLDVAFYGKDPDQSGLTVSTASLPLHGNISVYNNNLVYLPTKDYFGVDSVKYKLTDGEGDEATATVIYTVINVNDVPSANSDSVKIFEDQTDTIDVIELAYDPDQSGLTLHSVGGASHGTTLKDGNKVVYIPNANYFGSDALTFTVSDGEGDIASSSIVLTILPTNDVPLASNVELFMLEDITDSINVLRACEDIDLSGLSISQVTGATMGTATIRDSFVVYNPNLNFFGSEILTYTIKDGEGDEVSAQLTIYVNSVNDAPVAMGDAYENLVDETKVLNVIRNDYDVDEDPFKGTVQITTSPVHGSVQVVEGDTVRIAYTPNVAFLGYDSLQYTMVDTLGAFSNSVWAVIFTDSFNYVPRTVVDTVYLNEDTLSTFDVIANDWDVQGDSLWATIYRQPNYGVLEQTNSGSMKYTPNKDFFGIDTAYYLANDVKGLSTVGRILLNVLPLNDAPVLAVTPSDVDYTENSGWQKLLSNVSISDVDNVTLQGASVVLQSPVALTSDDIKMDAKDGLAFIGAAVDGGLNTMMSITIKGEASLQVYKEVLESIEYINNEEDDTVARSLSIVVYDRYGESIISSSNFTSTNIHLLPVNDAPVNVELPEIAGWVLPDSVLTVSTGKWTDVDGEIAEYTYQWMVQSNTEVPAIKIDGADKNTFTVPEEIAEAMFYCEVTAHDNGNPLPAQLVTVSANTVHPANFKPTGLMANNDAILRTTRVNAAVAELTASDVDENQAHTFAVVEGMQYFYTDGNELKLSRGAVYFESDVVTVSVKVTDNGPAHLSRIFDLSFTMINDLMPVMADAYPKVIETTGNGVSALVKADKPGKILYAAIDKDAAVPDYDAFVLMGETVLMPNAEVTVRLDGLESQSYYQLVIYMVDTIGVNVSEVSVVPFVTRDITDPEFVLNSPFVHQTLPYEVSIATAISEMGTVFYAIVEEGAELPNYDAVLSGTGAVTFGEWTYDVPHVVEYGSAQGLQTQMRYQMVLFIADTANNYSDLKVLSFATRDIRNPEFAENYPTLDDITGYRITYSVQFDEPGTVFVRVMDAGESMNDLTDLSRDGRYTTQFDVVKDSVYQIVTDPISLNGTYNLAMALQDSAGNVSAIKAINFVYPQPLEIKLYPTLAKTDITIVVSDEANYSIVSISGDVVQEGNLQKGENLIPVSGLSQGMYIVQMLNNWTKASRKFIRIDTAQ